MSNTLTGIHQDGHVDSWNEFISGRSSHPDPPLMSQWYVNFSGNQVSESYGISFKFASKGNLKLEASFFSGRSTAANDPRSSQMSGCLVCHFELAWPKDGIHLGLANCGNCDGCVACAGPVFKWSLCISLPANRSVTENIQLNKKLKGLILL